jgi:restriction endonuclease S subunit
MRFLELFEEIQKGDFGLTDAMIYRSIQMGTDFIPIWGGVQDHSIPDRYVEVSARTTKNKRITIFEGNGIVVSFDGSSGNMTYKENDRFALNHHAGFFKVRTDAVNKVDSRFFALFYQKQLQEKSISEGSKTLTPDQIYSMDFDIPDYKTQQRIMKILAPLLERKEGIKTLLQKISSLQNKQLFHENTKYQAQDIPLYKILDCFSGNSGLTEEYLYSQIQDKSEKRYRFLTASLDFRIPLFIHKCRYPKNPVKKIHTVDDKEIIHIVRNGIYAGSSTFFEVGNYTISDHAYLLCLKDNLQYQVKLKWLMYVLKHRFFEYLSSNDNRTWNKTKFFKEVSVDIPIYDEQIHVVEIFDKIETVKNSLIEINEKIDTILTKQISA